MATIFDVLFLGNIADLDPTEGNGLAENAGSIVGSTYGSSGDPLYDHIQTLAPGSTSYTGGDATAYNTDNNVYNEQFTIDGGSDQTMDTVLVYDATITYLDGTTATISAVLFQDTSGNLYLAPEMTANPDQAVLEAKPIQSLTLDTLVEDNIVLAADRDVADFVEVVDGTSGDDTMGVGYTDGDGDQIDGADGDDDWIESGDGNDTIISGDGNDTVYAGTGDDSIGDWLGDLGDKAYYGEEGNDTIIGQTGDDIIDGGTGNDWLTGDLGADMIYGGDGFDTIAITDDHQGDTIDGGEGVDDYDNITFANFISVSGVNATFTGDEAGSYSYDGAGADAWGTFTNIEWLIGTQYDDVMDASASTVHQQLQGEAGNDTLTGGAGDDTLDGGAGNDIINGDAPSEITYTVTSANLGSTGPTAQINDSSAFDVAFDSPASIRLEFGSMENTEEDLITIDGVQVDLQNLIDEGLATLSGGLAVGPNGGVTGTSWSATSGTITFNVPVSDITLDHSGGGYDDVSVEYLSDSGYVPIADYSNGATDVFATGNGSGDDTIDGGEGDDIIDAGGGDDTILLGDSFGNDTITGGETDETTGDTIDASAVTVPLTLVYTGAEAGTITDGTSTATFSDVEHVILGAGDDTADASTTTLGVDIDGGAGADTITGGTGDDTLTGGDGNDTFLIEDSWGTDTVFGGAVGDEDTLDFSPYTAGGVSVTFTGWEDGTASAGANSLTFDNIERIVGSDQDDVIDASADASGLALDGGAGADTITGGGDDDTITGGTGDDTLTGGGGNDTFTYTAGDGADTITDFNTGNTGTLSDGDSTNNDFIDLSALYDDIWELHADQADDGILNQSNDGVGGVDYSDNTQFQPGDSLTFTGASADGSSFTVENTGIVCFARGTRIRTPDGEIEIQKLRAGDRVITQDNGVQKIRWIGSSRVARTPKLQPIRIARGALGEGIPSRTLYVSPQHRMLIRSEIVERMTGSREVLVAAKKLTDMRGIHPDTRDGHIRYFHILCDAHEIVTANGAPAETLLPGPQAEKLMGVEAWAEITTIFPHIRKTLAQALPARPVVRARRKDNLTRRHRRNGAALVEPVS